MKIHQIVFSPTGGTEKVCQYLCEGLGGETVFTDLCLRADRLQVPSIEADDVAVIAMPVFAGRVPAVTVERLRGIDSCGARCVVVAVYGNRAYDDALLEMCDVAAGMGFRVVAAVGAVAEHSIARVYGTGRPDAADRDELAGFGRCVREKLEGAVGPDTLCVPGNRPYRPLQKGPAPQADGRCTGCGACSALCPVGAIPSDNPGGVSEELCISCMRCVSVCPNKARSIGPVEAMVTERLKPLCTVRKRNELFV